MRAFLGSDLTSWYNRINTVRQKENINLSTVTVPNTKGSKAQASHMSALKSTILGMKSNTYLAYATYDTVDNLNISSQDAIKQTQFDAIEAAIQSLEHICGNNSTTANLTTSNNTTTDKTMTCSNVSNSTTYNDCSTTYNECETNSCSTNSRTQQCLTTKNTTTYQNWSETVSPGSGNATFGASRITGSSSSLTTYSFSGDRTQSGCNRTYNSTYTSNYTTTNSTYSTYSSGNSTWSTCSTNSTTANSTYNTSADYTISNGTNTTTCITTNNKTSTDKTITNSTYGVVVD